MFRVPPWILVFILPVLSGPVPHSSQDPWPDSSSCSLSVFPLATISTQCQISMDSMHPQLKSTPASRILSCITYCCLLGSSICMQTPKQWIFSLDSTLQPISRFCLFSPSYATSATTQFRPFLSLCLDNCKLVFLFLSLIPLIHSSRGHQGYLSKHLFVSNQPLPSDVWWLPISCRVKSRFLGLT